LLNKFQTYTAGSSCDQDGAVRSRHRLEQVKQLLHRAAAPQNAAELVTLLELRAQVRVLRCETTLLDRLLEDMGQLVELKWLGDEIRGAALDRVDRILHGAVAGNHDGDDPWITLAGRFDDACAIDTGQAKVGDDDIEGELIEVFQRPLAGVRLNDLESALRQPLGHQAAQRRLVIDEQ